MDKLVVNFIVCDYGFGKIKYVLQVYTRQQLKDMLQCCGFSVLRQCNIDGGRLSETKTERILTVASGDLLIVI